MNHDLTLATPPGILDYLIVAISAVVLLVTLWLFLRAFGRRREDEAGHIKRRVLSDHVPRSEDEE